MGEAIAFIQRKWNLSGEELNCSDPVNRTSHLLYRQTDPVHLHK